MIRLILLKFVGPGLSHLVFSKCSIVLEIKKTLQFLIKYAYIYVPYDSHKKQLLFIFSGMEELNLCI